MNDEVVRLIIEIAGYVGMAVVVASFFFKNIKWLRLVNTVGAIICFTYGMLTKTYPTAALNLCLIIINTSFPVRYLIAQRKNKTKEDIDS